MAQHYVTERNLTIRLVCRAFRISETCYRYEPKLSDENAEIADCDGIVPRFAAVRP